MRRLRDFQVVSLSAGRGQTACRVVAVGGEQAVLELDDPRRVNDLILPAPATIGFQYGPHPVMLSGKAHPGPIDGTIRFGVTDKVSISEVRLAPRLTATFEVDAAPLSEDGSEAVPVTRVQAGDISAGGTFLTGIDARAEDRLALTLHLPGVTEPIVCVGRVVRMTPGGAAISFVELDQHDHDLIEAVIYTVRRAICRRAFEAASRTIGGAAQPVPRRQPAPR